MEDRDPRQIATYVVAAVVAIAIGVLVLGRGSAPPARIAIDGPAVAAPEGDPAGATVMVHVAGAVRRPGLYELDSRARVGDAVEQARGLLGGSDPTAVNLAARLTDGQQIVIPRRGPEALPAASPGEAPSASPAPGPAGPASSSELSEPAGPKLSLATATIEQLDAAAEGIGPTLAARVIEYRDANGPITTLDQLREVPGIGEARFQSLSTVLTP